MNIWRPYTSMANTHPIQINKAQGSHLITDNGQKIFDGISSWWLITHGHGHPLIAESIGQQAKKLEQVVFANFTHRPAEEFSELLSQHLPIQLSSVFFSDNGSTSVEVAMKMAYQFQALQNYPQKTKFIAFEKAYHGDTCGAMSVSSNSLFTRPFPQMRFDVLFAKQGQSIYDNLESWTSHFEELVEINENQVCAIIIEPFLQGAGGMIVWPKLALQRICRLAREKNILIIFDEVMTGFGRTGPMFAFQEIDVIPDILCLSKGVTGGFLPLGVTVASNELFHAFRTTTFYHGHSFTGNALSLAAAVANLKIFKEENTLSKIKINIKKAHEHFLKERKQKSFVKETRVCGSVGIMELKVDINYGDSFSREILNLVLKENIFIRPLGNVIYLMPPYCSTYNEVLDAWEKIEFVLSMAINL